MYTPHCWRYQARILNLKIQLPMYQKDHIQPGISPFSLQIVLVLASSVLCLPLSAQLTQYYFDISETPVPAWFDEDAWSLTPGGPGDTDWQNGATSGAVFADLSGTHTVQISSAVELNSWQVVGPTNANRWVFTGPGSVTFVGSNASFSGGHTEIAASLGLSGDVAVSLANNHRLTFKFGAQSAYVGEMTIQSGGGTGWVRFEDGRRLSSQSRFNINAPLQFQFDLAGTEPEMHSPTIGSISMSDGEVHFRRSGNVVTVNDFGGSGGALTGDNDAHTYTFRVNHSIGTNRVFAGDIAGTNGMSFIKQGEGGLSLTGDIDLRQTTVVEGGILAIDSTTTSFSGGAPGHTALTVENTGWLGGAGIITTGTNGSVAILSGGGLIVGTQGSASTLEFALHSAATLDLSSGSGSGWLRFDLGSNTDPGITYDQVVVSSGSLTIDGLEFGDFDFNLLAGFAPGMYVLFESSDLIGSLGGQVSGVLDGYTATLGIAGDSITLAVIPEPSTVAALSAMVVFGFVLIVRRRRR